MTSGPPLPPSASARLRKQQIVQALIWSQDAGMEDAPDMVAAFVERFMATWGEVTPATLLRMLSRFAPHASASDPQVLPSAMAGPVNKDGRDGMANRGDDSVYQEAPLDYDVLFALMALGITLADWPTETDSDTDSDDYLHQYGWMGMRAFAERPADALTAFSCDLLGRYLSSAHPRERWISAFWLGRLRDNRARTTLMGMLTEFMLLGHVLASDGDPVFFYNEWRSAVAPLLWQTGDIRLAATFRQALLMALEGERKEEWTNLRRIADVPTSQSSHLSRLSEEEAVVQLHSGCREWITYQHQMAYGLGQIGAFGALMSVPTPIGIYGGSWVRRGDSSVSQVSNTAAIEHGDQFRGYLWRIEACCGYLESTFAQPVGALSKTKRIRRFGDVPEFARAVEDLLEGQFGLEEGERHQAMHDYEEAYFLSKTIRGYEEVVQQAKIDPNSEQSEIQMDEDEMQPKE